MRCVVTGQTAEGKSVFVSDGDVEPVRLSLMPGAEFHRLWGDDRSPALPTDGTPPSQPRYFPPPGGYRFGFFTLPPASVTLPADIDFNQAIAELDAKLPGMLEVADPNEAGMHTTDTVDLDLVFSGNVWLELDDGEEVNLHPGDCVVQNGTRHAWHNRSDEPCLIFVTLLGATRQGS